MIKKDFLHLNLVFFSKSHCPFLEKHFNDYSQDRELIENKDNIASFFSQNISGFIKARTYFKT